MSYTRPAARVAGLCGLALVLLAPPLRAEPPSGQAPAARIAGDAERATPIGFLARVRAQATVLGTSAFPTDPTGTEYALDPTLDTQFRIRADYRNVWGGNGQYILTLSYEHDLMSGVVLGGAEGFDGVDAPYTADAEKSALRVASARLSLGHMLTLTGGAFTSHWGLGLVANDGAHGWTPGSAMFSDPRGGDRVLGALLASGPHDGLLVFTGYESVIDDDVLVDGDTAWQTVFGIRYAPQEALFEGGVYAVYRAQESPRGARTEVAVVDLYAKLERDLSPDLALRAELEAALIAGTTDLGPTPDHPQHDVLQGAAALRVALDAGLGGAVLDVLYASGDPAFDDGAQNGFKADRNFDLGLLFNDVVLAARTARTPVRADDPELAAVPAEDLDRLPTRGAATNTITFFPRGWWRPVDGLELYGGVLVALSPTNESDAFNARLGGGSPQNALGGGPATLVATEFDAGIRASGLFWGSRVVLGVEGGVLLPGAGLTGPDGLGEDAIYGGRVLATWEL
ncbi:MAG: hypothetical protein EP329_22955 [Deltaproteobacteria bacterium]|nr:MAG: hypothetical protein EP329_22955 [Deltaproteobacteria bacterium]